MQNFQVEQNIRTLVDEQLKNLGWNLSYGKDCNVFQEQPRTEEEKRKLEGKRPDYVLYSNKDKYRTEPILIIETKKPGANLDISLDQGNWYASKLNAPMVFATDGIYYKTRHIKFHKPLFLNGEEVNELIRELDALKFLSTNEVDTISKEVRYSREELIKIFDEANNLLRNEGLKAGMERFSEFANILFLKILGEIEDSKDEKGENCLINKDFRWNHWKDKNGDELLSFVNDVVLKKMEGIYKDADIFEPLKISNPNILKRIIDKLEPLRLININSDIKGDAFEYFLQKSTATKNDLGEYFTPRHIVKTMVKLANPQIGEKIYDPFCGTGGMLTKTFEHISNNMARTNDNWKQLKEKTIYGNEITSTARITKMNMILIGDGHCGIRQINSLKNPVNDQYDVVITNMPYSQQTEYGYLYDLPSNNGDSICVQHCIRAINKSSGNGRMVIIVPEGFLFRKDMQKTREYLLDRCYLKSVISLPQGVFLPYTGVKTNILYCTDIKKKKKQEKFWYFEVKNDGFTLDNHRKKIDGETDLQKFLAYRNIDAQEKRDVLNIGFTEINMDEVKENDLVLSGNRYTRIIDYGDIKWDVVSLGNQQYFEILSGGTPSSKIDEYWNGNINWATLVDLPVENFVTEIQDTERKITKKGLVNSSAKLLPPGSVIVSSRATIGRVAVNKKETATNQGFKNIIIKDKNKVNEKFLAYVILKLRDEMEQLASGGTFKEISKTNFEKLNVPLPPIEKQIEIVEELDSYQKIIDGSRQIISNWKPQIKVDSGWEIVRLGDFCDLMTGGTPKSTEKKYYENGKIPWLVSGDIHKGEIFECDGRITKEALVHSNARWLPINSVLIALNGQGKTRGTVALLRLKATCNQSIVSIMPRDKNKLIPEFLYYQLKTRYQEIRNITGDKQRSGLNMPIIRNIHLYLPSIEVQKEIVANIQSELHLIKPNEKIIETFENKIKETINFIWGK